MKWALEKLSALPAWKTPLAAFGVADKMLIDLILPRWVLRIRLLSVLIIFWRRRIWCHVYKSSVTCISKIYMVPSHGNKQSREMHSAPVGLCQRQLIFQQRKQILGRISKENFTLQRCVLVGIVAVSCSALGCIPAVTEVWTETATHLLCSKVSRLQCSTSSLYLILPVCHTVKSHALLLTMKQDKSSL